MRVPALLTKMYIIRKVFTSAQLALSPPDTAPSCPGADYNSTQQIICKLLLMCHFLRAINRPDRKLFFIETKFIFGRYMNFLLAKIPSQRKSEKIFEIESVCYLVKRMSTRLHNHVLIEFWYDEVVSAS